MLTLIEINSNFNNIINNNLYIFNDIHTFIYKTENGLINYKNYEKFNCFLIFYFNLIINNKISIDNLINLLNKLNNIFF